MQTWTCQMFYTRRITKFFSFTQKKRVNRDFLGKIIENGGCFPHLFWPEFQFLCNYLLQVFCENSSLDSANFTERVFFRNSSQKYSYTSAIRDKFCVCCNIIFFLKITRLRFKAFVTCSPYSQWLLALQSGLFRSLQGPTAQRAFLLPFWKLLTLWRCQLVRLPLFTDNISSSISYHSNILC